MELFGTKTKSEREDQETERLVRSLPKKKPPRHDRRRERVNVDPDLDEERDPDLSLNYKTIGGASKRVKVRRKKDDKVVEVSESTLRERGDEYEQYEEDDSPTPDEEGQTTPSKSSLGEGSEPRPSTRWPQEYESLESRAKNDPAFAASLRSLLDPKSDLGGLANGNPQFPAVAVDPDLPPNIKTLGDLAGVAQELFGPKPKGEPQRKEKPKEDDKKPTPKDDEQLVPRRTPSQTEVVQARQLILDTFPPKLAAKYITLHPDDARHLVTSYNDFKVGSLEVSDISREVRKVKNWSLSPGKIDTPTEIEVGGLTTKVAELPEDQRDELVQKHKMLVLGARLAVRSQAIKALRDMGATPRIAARVTDFMMSTSSLSPEERLEKAKEKAHDLFISVSSDTSQPTRVDPRFGTYGKTTGHTTTGKVRKALLSKVKDPSMQTMLVAAYQGEDFRTATTLYFGKDSPSRITESDTSKAILSKVHDATKFFDQQAKSYPPSVVAGLENPATIFRVKARHAISTMSRSKSRELMEPFAKDEAQAYDREMKQYERDRKRYQELVAKWDGRGQKGPPPVPPVAPVKPPQYSLVTPTNESAVRDERDRLLGVKKAYSTYPQLTVTQNQSVLHRFHAEGTMFTRESANRSLNCLDHMAKTVQENYQKLGYTFEEAKQIVNDLDRTADTIQAAAFGDGSLLEHQIDILREANVLERDSDEPYMDTFNAPMAPHQVDADEPYMSQFKDDQSEAVQTGVSTTGRPLAP